MAAIANWMFFRPKSVVSRSMIACAAPLSSRSLPSIAPNTRTSTTPPIAPFTLRSFITSLANDAKVPAGHSITLKGIAFDGGSGIKEVAVSTDDGKTWTPAKLGQDLGKYSFREWTLPVTLAAGAHVLKVRATANSGKVQPDKPGWNPAGYMRNVIESVRVTAA